jgi:hypothetical protein
MLVGGELGRAVRKPDWLLFFQEEAVASSKEILERTMRLQK